MILLVDSEGPDKTARICRLICAFAVPLSPKACFRMAWSIYSVSHEDYSLDAKIIRAGRLGDEATNTPGRLVLIPVGFSSQGQLKNLIYHNYSDILTPYRTYPKSWTIQDACLFLFLNNAR